MKRNDLIVIALFIIILAGGIGGYIYFGVFSHPTYGPGEYVVGKDIAPGTYERSEDSISYVLGGSFVSKGDILIVRDEPNSKVVVEKGNITYIDSNT